MAVDYPTIHPIFQVVPFEHLFRLLEDETADAIVAFFEKRAMKKGRMTYRELTKIQVKCVMSAEHPLAQNPNLTIAGLEHEKLILIDPQKGSDQLGELQYRLMKDKPAEELYFCDSVDAAVVLAKAGYGIAIVPDLPAPNDPSLRSVPLDGIEPISYGVYYKTLKGDPVLKQFLQRMEECDASGLSRFGNVSQLGAVDKVTKPH